MIWKPHVTVATVVKQADRYLLVEEDIRGKHVFNQPAGHLDPNETLIEAAKRETLEETGYVVEITGLIGIYQWHHEARDKHFIRHAFAAQAITQVENAQLDDGIIAAHWLTLSDLVTGDYALRSPMVLRNIHDFERGEPYSLDVYNAL